MKRRAAKGTVSYTNNTSKASDRITHQAWSSEVHSPPLTRTHSVTYSPTRQIDTIAWERQLRAINDKVERIYYRETNDN